LLFFGRVVEFGEFGKFGFVGERVRHPNKWQIQKRRAYSRKWYCDILYIMNITHNTVHL